MNGAGQVLSARVVWVGLGGSDHVARGNEVCVLCAPREAQHQEQVTLGERAHTYVDDLVARGQLLLKRRQ